jgi:hypothetical protein
MSNLEITGASSTYPEISTGSKGLIKEFQNNIALSYRKWKRRYREIEHSRRYALGKTTWRSQTITPGQANQEAGKIIKSNIIHATLQNMLPLIYAKNPEIAVKPNQHIDPSGYDYRTADLFSETLELILNSCLKKAELKRVAKQVLRSCMVSKIGILKITYQRDYIKDPLVSRQLHDAQESLAALIETIRQEDDVDKEDAEALIQRQNMIVESLEQQVTVMRREGLNLGVVRPEDFRMDTSLDTLQDYKQAQWMANRTWMTPKEVMSRFQLDKKDLEKFSTYRRNQNGIPQRLTKDSNLGEGEDVSIAIPVWEYWDKITQTVYTWAEGGDSYIKVPFHPQKMGDSWFPFFILGLNWIDGEEWPISDVDLLENLQDEYMTIRTQAAKHRDLAAPFYVADSSRINYEDIETFSNATIGDIALINASGAGVNTVFQPASTPPFNPMIYDTSSVRSDIEWISGLGDAARGSVARSKTATEANILQEGLSTRTGEKVDLLEDWLKDVATFSAEILLQEMPPEMVMQEVGQNAFWPKLDKQTLYDRINVEIKAGSTEMPDKNQEQMRWVELMPIIMQNIDAIQAMRMQGIPDEFNPFINLVKETFKRFDERIDVVKFIPPLPEDVQEYVMQNEQMQGAMNPQMGGQPAPKPGGRARPEFVRQENSPANRVNQRSRNQYRDPQDLS